MAGSYLLIDHDHFGIKAMIMDETNHKKTVRSRCEILFKDLQESPETSGSNDATLFNAAMDSVAEKMVLSSCSTAVILISPLAVHFRTINLPFRSEKKIQQILPFELEPLLPTSTETYISDFHFLNQQADLSMILTASIAEARIEPYFLKLGSFGIRPKMITPAGYAGAVTFLKDHPQISDFGFLHITEDRVALILIHNRKPWAVRTLPASFQSAEALAACVHQTITGFCQKTGEDIAFDLIVGFDQNLLGMDGFLNTLQNALAGKMRQGTLNPDALNNQSLQAIDINELLMTVSPNDTEDCLVNFCKGKYSSTSFLKTYFYSIVANIVLFFCVMGLWMFSTGLDNSVLYKKISFLDATALSIFMKTFPDQKRIQDPYLQMKANVQETLKKTGADSDKNQALAKEVRVVDVLSELSTKIAPSIDVEISSFLLNAGRLVLSGSTGNFNNVDQIKTSLESSDLYKKVGISSAAADKKGDRVNFKFNIDL